MAGEHGETRRPEVEYEPPRVTVHGSLAEVTAANLIGTVFDKSIPAGASIVSIFGGTSF